MSGPRYVSPPILRQAFDVEQNVAGNGTHHVLVYNPTYMYEVMITQTSMYNSVPTFTQNTLCNGQMLSTTPKTFDVDPYGASTVLPEPVSRPQYTDEMFGRGDHRLSMHPVFSYDLMMCL